jgi:hypothetical protein
MLHLRATTGDDIGVRFENRQLLFVFEKVPTWLVIQDLTSTSTEAY